MSERRIPFNVNNYVRIKLNDTGREIIRERNMRVASTSGGQYCPSMPAEDAGGWSRWQLWDLMQKFGPHMGLGVKSPFETTIEFIVHDDAE